MAKTFPRIELCQTLNLSRSTSYAHPLKPNKPRRKLDQLLTMKLRAAFLLSRQTYGSPRLQADLRDQGYRCGKNRISRLMKAAGLQARQKRKFRPTTTQSDPTHHSRIAPNDLARFPSPDKPNQVWQSDITYLPTKEGWLYLAGIIDACSRKMVGYACGEELSTSLVVRVFKKAQRTRSVPHGLLHHSDRGCQYTSCEFATLLSQSRIAASMSRRGNCYDNALKESFWATLKTECFGNFIPETKEQARLMVFDYIETFYNKRRKHSSLNRLAPNQFESLIESQNQNN